MTSDDLRRPAEIRPMTSDDRSSGFFPMTPPMTSDDLPMTTDDPSDDLPTPYGGIPALRALGTSLGGRVTHPLAPLDEGQSHVTWKD